VGYGRGTLVLRSGAVAARLRHLTRLLLTIRKQFPEVKAITEVQLVRARASPRRSVGLE
jgi:hypothetical protein